MDDDDDWLFEDPALLKQLESVENYNQKSFINSSNRKFNNSKTAAVQSVAAHNAQPFHNSKVTNSKQSTAHHNNHTNQQGPKQMSIEAAFGNWNASAKLNTTETSHATVIDLTSENNSRTDSTSNNSTRQMINNPAMHLTSANSQNRVKQPIAAPSRSSVSTVSQMVSLRYNSQVPHSIDREAMRAWVYPMNYPKRQYQFNILHTCLFHNTLVCLPTGLGKTFIAAVLMFNFWRWFTRGKVIFMAPTKPLVAQQKEACFKITGLSQLDTVELTGTIDAELRREEWRTKRVFFITPQILQNDLKNGVCKSDDIVCIVIDEAHKATGNYAYCECVKLIEKTNAFFRVLALSATPGSDKSAVQSVIENLNIARIELRTEESMDLREYIHARKKDVIVVQLNDFIKKCLQTMQEQVLKPFLTRLKNRGAVRDDNPNMVSKFGLVEGRKGWRFRNLRNNRGGNSNNGYIEGDFAVCISLSHAIDLLIRHGITPFYKYCAETAGMINSEDGGGSASKGIKGQLRKCAEFMTIMNDLKAEMTKPTYLGHPKLNHLEAVVLEHFTSFNDSEHGLHDGGQANTRVMIFSEYRDSVEDIVCILNKHEPLLRTMSFVGQASKKSKGLTQKEQLQVVEKFKSGGYNVLVATCIGEEGLDIGEVDLIICYDTQSSPIRMLQRMGRTGRKRSGRIVTLVTAGKEEAQVKKVENTYKEVQRIIAESKLDLYTDDVRMVPGDIKPVVDEKILVIPEYQKPAGKKLTSKKSSTTADSKINKRDIFTDVEWRVYSQLYMQPNSVSVDLDRIMRQKIPVHAYRSKSGTSSLNEMYIEMKEKFVSIETGDDITGSQWMRQVAKVVEVGETSNLLPRRRKSRIIKEMVDEESFIADDDNELPTMNDVAAGRPVARVETDDDFYNRIGTCYISPIFQIEDTIDNADLLITTEKKMPSIRTDMPYQDCINVVKESKSFIDQLKAFNSLARQYENVPEKVDDLPHFEFRDDECALDIVVEQTPIFKLPEAKVKSATPSRASRASAPSVHDNSYSFVSFDDDLMLLEEGVNHDVDFNNNDAKASSEYDDGFLMDDDGLSQLFKKPRIQPAVSAKPKPIKNTKKSKPVAISVPSSDIEDDDFACSTGKGRSARTSNQSSPLFKKPSNKPPTRRILNSSPDKSLVVTDIQFIDDSPVKRMPTPRKPLKHAKRTKSKFIDAEVSGTDSDAIEDEDEEYSSSLDGWIKKSQLTSPVSGKTASSAVQPTYVPHGVYKMKLNAPLSQRLQRGELRYIWAADGDRDDDGDDDVSDEDLDSFVVDDEDVEYDSQEEEGRDKSGISLTAHMTSSCSSSPDRSTNANNCGRRNLKPKRRLVRRLS